MVSMMGRDSESETTVSRTDSRGDSPRGSARASKMASAMVATMVSIMVSRRAATRGKMAVKPARWEKASTVKAWTRADSYVRSVMGD